jgi:hypothetical protein
LATSRVSVASLMILRLGSGDQRTYPGLTGLDTVPPAGPAVAFATVAAAGAAARARHRGG